MEINPRHRRALSRGAAAAALIAGSVAGMTGANAQSTNREAAKPKVVAVGGVQHFMGSSAVEHCESGSVSSCEEDTPTLGGFATLPANQPPTERMQIQLTIAREKNIQQERKADSVPSSTTTSTTATTTTVPRPAETPMTTAPRETVVTSPTTVVAQAPPATGTESISADMSYIFTHESGNSLTAENADGCLGLGQACPGSKLVAACPDWQTDYTCQLDYFTSYADSTYGGWAGAYEHELVDHWW
jgi:hypothetical protein